MKRIISIASIIAFALTVSITAQNNKRVSAKGLAVYSNDGQFKPYDFSRHAIGDNDIQIDILYAGICHSDLHHAHEEWGHEEYPMVPGHEIAGRVVKVGKNVTKFKVGDLAGVGCMVNSCGKCEFCLNNKEQYCTKVLMTYHGHDWAHENEITQGGYSNNIVLTEKFAIKIPANAQIEKVAPLLCAGITTYSPIRQVNVIKGDKVAVAGFGGLGHMALKYMVEIGAEVTVFDITDEKHDAAIKMGAVRYVNVNNPESLKGLENTFSFILSTVPAKYDPTVYMKMLKLDGQLCIVGLPAFNNMPSIGVDKFVFLGGRKVFGSQIGGIKETQEMLDYSVEHNLYPDVEVIKADGSTVTDAYKKVLNGEVRFRYVIDMKTLK